MKVKRHDTQSVQSQTISRPRARVAGVESTLVKTFTFRTSLAILA